MEMERGIVHSVINLQHYHSSKDLVYWGRRGQLGRASAALPDGVVWRGLSKVRQRCRMVVCHVLCPGHWQERSLTWRRRKREKKHRESKGVWG